MHAHTYAHANAHAHAYIQRGSGGERLAHSASPLQPGVVKWSKLHTHEPPSRHEDADGFRQGLVSQSYIHRSRRDFTLNPTHLINTGHIPHAKHDCVGIKRVGGKRQLLRIPMHPRNSCRSTKELLHLIHAQAHMIIFVTTLINSNWW